MSLLPVNARKGERSPSGAKVLLFPSSSALDPLQGISGIKGTCTAPEVLAAPHQLKKLATLRDRHLPLQQFISLEERSSGKKWRCYPCNNISQLISNFHLDVLGRCRALSCGGQQPAGPQELFAWRTDIPGTFYLQVVSENSQVEVISCSDGRSAVDTSRGHPPSEDQCLSPFSLLAK